MENPITMSCQENIISLDESSELLNDLNLYENEIFPLLDNKKSINDLVLQANKIIEHGIQNHECIEHLKQHLTELSVVELEVAQDIESLKRSQNTPEVQHLQNKNDKLLEEIQQLERDTGSCRSEAQKQNTFHDRLQDQRQHASHSEQVHQLYLKCKIRFYSQLFKIDWNCSSEVDRVNGFLRCPRDKACVPLEPPSPSPSPDHVWGLLESAALDFP